MNKDPKKLAHFVKCWFKFCAAVVDLRKAGVALADPKDPADAIRLSRIDTFMPQVDKLHSTYLAIANAEGVDVGTLGGGPTPRE